MRDGRCIDIGAVATDDLDPHHHHPRRAKAALQPVIFLERGLHRMERIPAGQPLDRRHRRAVERDREHGARFGGDAVDQHVARAALAGVTADVRAGEAEIVAQQLDEQGFGRNVPHDRRAVQGEGGFHAYQSAQPKGSMQVRRGGVGAFPRDTGAAAAQSAIPSATR